MQNLEMLHGPFDPQINVIVGYWTSFIKSMATPEQTSHFQETLQAQISGFMYGSLPYAELRFGVGIHADGHSAYNDALLKKSLLATQNSLLEPLLPRETHTVINKVTGEVFLEKRRKPEGPITRLPLRR